MTEAEKRKQTPIFSGVVRYFPLALEEVARVSFIGNEQHNKGQPLHWDRSKSKDEADALMRHLTDYAKGIDLDADGVPHLGKAAWRALALLQKYLEGKQTPLNKIIGESMEKFEQDVGRTKIIPSLREVFFDKKND